MIHIGISSILAPLRNAAILFLAGCIGVGVLLFLVCETIKKQKQ